MFEIAADKFEKLYESERKAHAETRAELDEARRALVRDKLDAAFTRAERKVLEAMAKMKHRTLSDVVRTSAFYPPCQAELARRGEKP